MMMLYEPLFERLSKNQSYNTFNFLILSVVWGRPRQQKWLAFGVELIIITFGVAEESQPMQLVT
jgi:hypothetical protein